MKRVSTIVPPINCVVLCGPTASGKTRLGVQVASWLGGEIISADSRQVYRGMDNGTGKDLAEYENDGHPVPCHLFDVADPAEIYSLWYYQLDFFAVFALLLSSGKLPVVVGGTGLYIEAVLKLYRIPDVPEDVEKRRELMSRSSEELLKELGELDPAILEQTDVSSKKRIVRSLEVALYAQDHELRWGIPDPPDISPLILCIRTARPELRERIRRRLADRFDEGMIEEVGRLISEGVSRERLNVLGMEYRHVARFLAGEVSRETMEEELLHAIHRLAKRQDTWFRGMERRGLPVAWLDGPDLNQAREVLKAHLNVAR